jgi:hypothetical protein
MKEWSVPKQASHKMQSYRLRIDAIEALSKLQEALNQKLNIRISKTQILELLIIDAAKSNGEKVAKLIQNK